MASAFRFRAAAQKMARDMSARCVHVQMYRFLCASNIKSGLYLVHLPGSLSRDAGRLDTLVSAARGNEPRPRMSIVFTLYKALLREACLCRCFLCSAAPASRRSMSKSIAADQNDKSVFVNTWIKLDVSSDFASD